MRIGIFADSHDHLENLRRAVALFNEWDCEAVLFAGDLVSTFALPPLRRLRCPLIGCFGDNEGNKVGLLAGLRRGDVLAEPPFGWRAADGTRFVLAHMERQLRGMIDGCDVCVVGHTHKPRLQVDAAGRLWINPGEASGWTFGRPTVVLFETQERQPTVVDLWSLDTATVAQGRSAGAPRGT
ncbi:MAG: phosphodiesterase [Pirellulaceae bacterium]|nr:MAG: phosphodiesterase [Pirellulaceae bacterium]